VAGAENRAAGIVTHAVSIAAAAPHPDSDTPARDTRASTPRERPEVSLGSHPRPPTPTARVLVFFYCDYVARSALVYCAGLICQTVRLIQGPVLTIQPAYSGTAL
jgi:hypothetical protein